MSSIAKLWRKLRDKAYRDGYTEAQHSIEVPFQIRAIRKARGWTQAQLAKRSGIPQARISHVEQPGRDPLSLRTLYRLAAAFDVGLLVQFVPFSELVRREAAFDPETFRVPSFADDPSDQIGTAAKTTDTLATKGPCATNRKCESKIRVVFFEMTEDENGAIVHENEARMVMSPQHAMAFSQALNSTIEQWAKEHAADHRRDGQA